MTGRCGSGDDGADAADRGPVASSALFLPNSSRKREMKKIV